MVKVNCDNCGKEVLRKPSAVSPHNFCNRECFKIWQAPRLAEYCRTQNPMNKPEAWTAERRAMLRQKNKEKGENRAYKKVYGKHIHRVAAEMMLGRELLPGEIVHHKNGDKTDNRFENLEVMTQSQHASLHFREYWRKRKGGDEKHDSKK